MTLQHQLPLSHALGWAAPELLGLAKDYPDLALQLLTVPRQRLHFVAFVLAMTAPPVSADLVHQAVSLPAREVLARLGLSDVQGIRRVLGRIYGPVLDRDRYREIAGLLSEPTTAQVLYHASEVTPELLANLSTLPLTLRSHVIADAIGQISNAAAHLIEWTEIVAAMGNAPIFAFIASVWAARPRIDSGLPVMCGPSADGAPLSFHRGRLPRS
jgi:hypothetical protein